MLDFRIETFLCVCKYMNFTKAAEELNITQPGVSQHIKYLENYYGDKLFIYKNKMLYLTPAGQQLKDAMLSIKHDNIYLKDKILEQASAKSIIKLGATLTVGEFMLPQKIIDYSQRNYNAQIELVIANTKELLSLLDDGRIDFAIIEGYFQKSQYEFITVSIEKYTAVCGRDYQLKTVNEFADLFRHKLLLREDGSGTKEILERYLSDNGYSINNFSNTSIISSIHVIKQLLMNNCGISFMYKIAVDKELKEGSIREINIPGFDVSHEFNYIWRKNSVFSDHYKSLFREIIQDNNS